MPSHSSRSSTVDGDYETWEQPSLDSKKKSRSKLPAEDKLNVSAQCLGAFVRCIDSITEAPRSKSCLSEGISAKERKTYQRVRGQSRGIRTPPGVRKPREQSSSFANEPYGRRVNLLSPSLVFWQQCSDFVTTIQRKVLTSIHEQLYDVLRYDTWRSSYKLV